jgi:phosphoheptose isomerase
LFGITASGRSPDVLRALEAVRGMRIVAVGLPGDGGGWRTRCATTR